ncbi:MAG: CDP-glucose 4,6-dehydratase [Candidatus Accumulibacter sp. 66-26]|nr:CDP-glucose 4,6-dehydratase [Accumulibacter sp.]OJW47999.1 MAG: CDP-glucose 4,6-dehydratase [Candidatus Accumulibacter sp. 66-26]
MENLVTASFWKDKRVFLTGHTGFKGSWLALWLQTLGARVHGYSLPPPTDPNLFSVARVAEGLSDARGDLRDATRLNQALHDAQPQIVLHLAAQALVEEGYRDPVGTYASNLTGTLNLLEAVRSCASVQAVVVVTSDKCYQNREWSSSYREQDPLGGYDPYSSSKAAVEILTASYRDSFLRERGVATATARAGNVIGGGDWAPRRLVPDALRAFAAETEVVLRHPNAIRPWQHVLEPLAGYLLLAEHLVQEGNLFASAWNFGPDERDPLTVGKVVERLARQWGDGAQCSTAPTAGPHEAQLLKLDSGKARSRLGWQPRWTVETALQASVDWHRAWLRGADMRAFTLAQINDYSTTDTP